MLVIEANESRDGPLPAQLDLVPQSAVIWALTGCRKSARAVHI